MPHVVHHTLVTKQLQTAVGKQQRGLALAELKLSFGGISCVAGEPVSAALQLWTSSCTGCLKQAET
ncbi:MAG: hypothetical protein FRX49_12792 [Trebouxia sp. A1-2]|nr:MAG: hypothetical protein FRX49_12792 [Trebouxia sp. A1-2]